MENTKENMWRNVTIHPNNNYQVSATCSNCNDTIKLSKLTELPSTCPKCQADMRQVKKNKVIVPDDYVSRYELVKHLIGVLDGWRQPLKYSTIDEEIVAFPAADVRPVKRGKWHDCYQLTTNCYVAVCSSCGEKHEYIGGGFLKFCPNCGADMGEAQENV